MFQIEIQFKLLSQEWFVETNQKGKKVLKNGWFFFIYGNNIKCVEAVAVLVSPSCFCLAKRLMSRKGNGVNNAEGKDENGDSRLEKRLSSLCRINTVYTVILRPVGRATLFIVYQVSSKDGDLLCVKQKLLSLIVQLRTVKRLTQRISSNFYLKQRAEWPSC